MIETNEYGHLSYLNNGYQNEQLKIFALYDLLKENYSSHWFGYDFLLREMAYEEVEKEDSAGNTYNSREDLLEYDSVSRKAYYDQLVQNKESLQTAEAIKNMVIDVNSTLKEEVDAYKNTRKLIDGLFKEDRYDYDAEDQLREGITQKEIDGAMDAVQSLSDQFSEKVRDEMECRTCAIFTNEAYY